MKFQDDALARFRQQVAEEVAEEKALRDIVRRMREGVARHQGIVSEGLTGAVLERSDAMLNIVDAAIRYASSCIQDGEGANSYRLVGRTRVRNALRAWLDLQGK
jgi:hypothetical protein